MEGDQQLEAETTHPKQKAIFCSLAQTYLIGVVNDFGQRDIFAVLGALDPGLPCGQSLLSRLQTLLSLCKSCRICSQSSSPGHPAVVQALLCRSCLPSPKPLFLSGHKPVLSSATHYFFWQNPVSAYFQPEPIASLLLFAQFLVTMCDIPVFPVWLCCALREVTSSSALCIPPCFSLASCTVPTVFPSQHRALGPNTLPALLHSDFLHFIFQRHGEK